jgi:hypothetical protein
MCFQAKIQTLVQVTMAEIESKSGKPAAYISPYYSPNRAKDSIGKSDYQQLEKKADRCEFAEQSARLIHHRRQARAAAARRAVTHRKNGTSGNKKSST